MAIFMRGRRLGARARRGGGFFLVGASLVVAQLATVGPVAAYHDTYVVVASNGTLTPGTTNIGLAGDDAVRSIELPFPVTFFDQRFTSATVSTNGNIQFNTADRDVPDPGECLPEDDFGAAIFAYFADLDLASYGSGAGGVFTATTGTAPNRRFFVEWRGEHVDSQNDVNFEVQFTEGSRGIHVIYGSVGSTNAPVVIGVQASNTGPATLWRCEEEGGTVVSGTRLTFRPAGQLPGDCANEESLTNTHDDFDGGRFGDKIWGMAGDDVVRGMAGNDCLYGGLGHDQLSGQTGRDLLRGGQGQDRLFGQESHDRLLGESGADHLDGGTGNDVLEGGDQGDTLIGDEGRDTLDGGDGPDVIRASDGEPDIIFCREGVDVVRADSRDVFRDRDACELVVISDAS